MFLKALGIEVPCAGIRAMPRSWSSVLAESSVTNVWDIKFPYCILPAEWIQTKESFRELNVALSKIALWDFEQLLRGQAPTLRYDGQASPAWLSGKELGLRGAYVGIRADWKARRELHHCMRHYGCNHVCDLCWACRPHVDPEWSFHKVWDVEGFPEDPEMQSPWLGLPGAHVHLHLFDLMHVLFIGEARALSRPS